jgi:hypothetical protein
MFAILKKVADEMKDKGETHQAVLRFHSGNVMHVEEFIEVRTNSVKVKLMYASKSAGATFLPEAIEAVEIRCR